MVLYGPQGTTGKQVSPPSSPSAALANFLYQPTLCLMQNFSPITYPSKGIRWLLCECQLVTFSDTKFVYRKTVLFEWTNIVTHLVQEFTFSQNFSALKIFNYWSASHVYCTSWETEPFVSSKSVTRFDFNFDPIECSFDCASFTFIFFSGDPRAKHASRAPWLSKCTHPRKFGNHVTVHRPSVRTTGKPMFNLTL